MIRSLTFLFAAMLIAMSIGVAQASAANVGEGGSIAIVECSCAAPGGCDDMAMLGGLSCERCCLATLPVLAEIGSLAMPKRTVVPVAVPRLPTRSLPPVLPPPRIA